MFLYRFVCRRLQILVYAITFEQLFGFLSFLARLLTLTCRLPDQIFGDFRRDLGLDLEFSRSNMEFAISQPKMVQLPRNKKQIYRLNSRAQMWWSDMTLAMTLTFEFSRSNMKFAISQPKVVRLPQNEKQTFWLNSRPQMWPMGLTLTMTLKFECWRLDVTLIFDHTHDLDHGFWLSNFEIVISQIGRADWHCTKGVAVGHSWPWPWPLGDQDQVYGSTR